MQIDTGQHQRLDQRMTLSPRVIQSMEILQMPTLALAERIEQELASNPTLELEDEPDGEAPDASEREQQERDETEGERELTVSDAPEDGHADDFERLENLATENAENWGENPWEGAPPPRRQAASADGRDPKLEAMANTEARPTCLFDQLMDQWRLVEARPEVFDAGAYLLGHLDADGYLRTPWAELAGGAPRHTDEATLEAALAALQRHLEPPGLGARNLQECLRLQLEVAEAAEPSPELEDARRVLEHHLPHVEANRLPRIARATGWPLARVKRAIATLARFHPRPGRRLADVPADPITPDARVRYDPEQDRYVAELIDDRLPGVNIVPSYQAMARDREVNQSTRKFLSGQLQSARWLIDAIAQRRQTLMRVIDVVLEQQRDFFEQGATGLKSLPMTEVADRLGIHVATVSRAVHEEYLETPRGILPLRMFFSGGTETGEGRNMSWTAVQATLKQLIDEEDKRAPLSDDALAEALKAKGITIARRTVAKYRKEMGIPSIQNRKEYE